MKKLIFLVTSITASLLYTSISLSAPPIGDTQGKVSSVYLKPVTNDEHKMRVYFSTDENNRYGCLTNPGYVEITEASQYVSTEQFKMMLSMALAAQASGKSLSIDSPGGEDPCSQGNSARVISD